MSNSGNNSDSNSDYGGGDSGYSAGLAAPSDVVFINADTVRRAIAAENSSVPPENKVRPHRRIGGGRRGEMAGLNTDMVDAPMDTIDKETLERFMETAVFIDPEKIMARIEKEAAEKMNAKIKEQS